MLNSQAQTSILASRSSILPHHENTTSLLFKRTSHLLKNANFENYHKAFTFNGVFMLIARFSGVGCKQGLEG